MKTVYWYVDKSVDGLDDYPQIKEAAALLVSGEVVAFPTETVYGLGADATSEQAVNKIFAAKGRPSDNPLIVHIANRNDLFSIAAEIPEAAAKLMDKFWPGPLTLILKKKKGIAENVTAGLGTVAVRMPNHPVAAALIKASNRPLAAPSANLSGKPSPTAASHVLDDLSGRIAGVVDGGTTGVGLESTVLDCTSSIPVILRPGGVTKEQLEGVIGEVHIDQALVKEGEAPKSPGMKYTHYAPNAPLIIVYGSREFIQSAVDEKKKAGERVGVLAAEENKDFYQADVVIPCGSNQNLETVASHLYDVLRTFDKEQVDIIFSESFPEDGVGQAVMNRLRKAAGHQSITE